MGSQTKYDRKRLVYVSITIPEADGENAPAGESLKYAFFTNIPSSKSTELGHVLVPESSYTDPPLGLVLAASFPKPARATLREALRCTSSYVAKDKHLAARKEGYVVNKFRGRSRLVVGRAALVQGVFVTMRGVKYGWNIPKVSITNAGDLAGIGVKTATAADLDEVCTGCNFPKPPRASITKISGDDIKTISTYYDPSVDTLPANWKSAQPGRYGI